jgi:hypothetical protein
VNEWRQRLTALFAYLHDFIRDKFIELSNPPVSSPTPSVFSPPPSQPQYAFPSPTGTDTARRYVDEKGIVRTTGGDPVHGGSTSTLVVMVKDENGSGATLITANVGDSTALLVPSPCKVHNVTQNKYEFLTVDHGPENSDEFARVHALPASTHPQKLLFVYDKTNVFRKYECPAVFLDDGTKDQTYVGNPW